MGETRPGTEKRCSHILQSGHLACWSVDNCNIFPKLNILEVRSKPNSTILKKYVYIVPLCFSRITYFGTEIAKETKHQRQSLGPCKFLTDNNKRWTIGRVYRIQIDPSKTITTISFSPEP